MLHSPTEHRALLAAQAPRQQSRHQGRKLRYEGTRMACPMCRASSEIRTSFMPSETMRETFYQCTNVECGCTFVFTGEITRLLNPGATPNPAVRIPLSMHVRRDMVRVLLDHAEHAPHQARYTLPVTGDLFAGGDPAGEPPP